MKFKQAVMTVLINVFSVLLIYAYADTNKDLCKDLDGLWILTEKSPVHPQNSSPNGFPNIRWFFDSKTNTLFQSMPDDKKKAGANKEQSKA